MIGDGLGKACGHGCEEGLEMALTVEGVSGAR